MFKHCFSRLLPLLFAFLGDLCRFWLIFDLFCFAFVVKTAGFNTAGEFVFPTPLVFAPLALFPIMILVLFFDPDCRSFTKLYTAGKLISIAGCAAWIIVDRGFFKFSTILIMIQSGNQKQLLLLVSAPLIIIWDALSLILLRISRRGNVRAGSAGEVYSGAAE